MKDVEREDALDILALMVERSLGFSKNKICSDEKKESSSCDGSSDDTLNSTLIDVQNCLEYFRNLSNQQADENGLHDHETRMKILDELEQCHIYSAEMRRAAFSASTWLRSVRTNPSAVNPSNNDISLGKRHSHERLFQTLSQAYQEQLDEKDNMNRKLDQELSTCRAEIGRLKSMNRNEVSRIIWTCFSL